MKVNGERENRKRKLVHFRLVSFSLFNDDNILD